MHLAQASYTDPDALQQLLSAQTEAYFLIDVRTFDEYVSGHIPSAINIPYDIIADHLPTPGKVALILFSGLHCASSCIPLCLGLRALVPQGVQMLHLALAS
jgi:rhodanese-related sulfurtransferase